MIRTLALIACLAGAACGSSLSWNSQTLLVKFGYTIEGIGTEAYIPIPVYKDNATDQGWTEQPRPAGPEGYSSLLMYCPDDDLTVCPLYDDTGFIGGLQIAVDQEYVSNVVFDWDAQGFTEWNVTLSNGTSKTYWTRQQYYVSPTTLTTSAVSRVAARNISTVLQDTDIWVTGPYGKLYNISTNYDYVTGSGSPYTKQGCFPWMGQHYYYNMTESLECSADQLFGWFPLVYFNRVVAVGTVVFAKYTAGNKYYEYPTVEILKWNVPYGPECLYNMPEYPGMFTVHTYFVDPAYAMNCVYV